MFLSLAPFLLVLLSTLPPTIALLNKSVQAASTAMRTSAINGKDSSADGDSSVQRVVIAGAGVIGVSTAYYLAKDFGVGSTLIDPTGRIAPAASGKAGGFLALDWNDHSPGGPLTRRSFALHQEIADELGADNIQYRRLECVTIPVGDSPQSRRPSGRKLEGIEWAEGENAMGDANILGDRSTIAQVHPKMLCEAMWEKIKELTPESQLVRGTVVSEVYEDDGTVGAKLKDGTIIEGSI